MASTLPYVDPCCTTTCTSTTSVQIPGPIGPEGPEGPPGADGTSGLNAYTTLSANFTMPAEQLTGQASVVNTGWMVIGQILYVQTLGYLRVVTVNSSVLVTLRNLEDTANNAYLINSPVGTIANSGSRVGPGGEQGPAGTYAAILIDYAPGTPPPDPTQPALGYSTGGSQLLQWDVASQTWV